MSILIDSGSRLEYLIRTHTVLWCAGLEELGVMGFSGEGQTPERIYGGSGWPGGSAVRRLGPVAGERIGLINGPQGECTQLL